MEKNEKKKKAKKKKKQTSKKRKKRREKEKELAKEAIPESAVLSGPSTEVYSTGAMFQSNRGIFLDDGLSEDEWILFRECTRSFTGKFLQCINISMILIQAIVKVRRTESHLPGGQSIPSGPGVALIWAIGLKVRKDGSCCDLKASELETQHFDQAKNGIKPLEG